MKFNLSLCTESPGLQKTCRNILRNTSFQLRDNTIGGVIVKLKELSSIRNKSYNTLKETISSNELTKVCEEIKMETELLWKPSHLRVQRDIKENTKEITFSHQRKNRRFRKSKRRRHNNERKTKKGPIICSNTYRY